jgi:hypothetical protein
MTDMIRNMLKGMHYQFNGERLKVITNAYKFHVRMTKDGFRVMGANKVAFVKSFDDVLVHIKSHA